MKRQPMALPAAAALMMLCSTGIVRAVPLTSQVVFGGAGTQQGTGVAVSGGNVYFSGVNTAASDGMLGRYNSALTTPSWSQLMGGSPFGDLRGVAVSNIVYSAGSSRNSPLVADGVGGFENKSVAVGVGLGGGAYTFRTQTPAGAPFLPYSGTEASYGIAVANSGGVDSIYTAGFAQADGSGTGYNMTVAKLNQAGNTVATATFNTGQGTFGFGVTTLGGNVFVAGSAGASANAVIRAYNGNLGFLWMDTAVVGNYSDVTAYNGAIYAVGGLGTTGFVSRFDPVSGVRLWTQSYAGDSLNGIVGANGSLYAVGSSGSDAVLLTLDAATGAQQNAQTFGGAGTDVFNDVAVDSVSGALYAIGTTDSASLGANGSDVWIAGFATPTPEPTSAALLGLGTLLLAARRRRSA